MMRWLIIGIFVGSFFLVNYYFLDYYQADDLVEVESMESKVSDIHREEKNIPEKLFQPSLIHLIGMYDHEITRMYGEPIRKDKSAYGYEWWIYKDGNSSYLQFGILDQKVITIYAIGDGLDLELLQIGQTYDELNNQFNFDKELTYEDGHSFHSFQLTEEDLSLRPLIRLENDSFIQLYFDVFTKKLSSIRILTGDVLLLHRDYETLYRGNFPKRPNLNHAEWKEIESGMEKQIFDITNILRVREGETPVQWEDTVREVAYDHSLDMAENNYFSHFALNGDGLKERLAEKEILYTSAGENIAAHYVDAPAVMEAWMNSESHREALLSDNYTHLGVGVYRLYYTQNFLAQDF